MKKSATVALMTIAVSMGLAAHDTIKTVSLSGTFRDVAGTPRIIRDSTQNRWVVTWRQQGSPSTIMGRTVDASGNRGALKVLASGVGPAIHNHDLAQNSSAKNFLLAYETPKGLFVQRLSANLARQGSPTQIAAGGIPSNPRLSFDPSRKRYMIFWLADQAGAERSTLMGRRLGADGKPTAAARILAEARAGRSFGIPSASMNPETKNLLVLLTERTSTTARLLGYIVKPDGSLLRQAPLSFQGMAAGFDTLGDANYSDEDGSGVAFWSDRAMLKARRLSPTGSFASGVKVIANSADGNSFETSLAYDSRNEQFVGFWAMSNKVLGVGLDESSLQIVDPPFQVASSTLGESENAQASFHPGTGTVLVVWEDATSGDVSTQVGYKVRGALVRASPGPSSASVSIGDNFFSPKTLSIELGTTVTWKNDGLSPHTVTSGSPDSSPGAVFDSPTLSPGQTFQFQFNNPGTFPYFCRVHGAMQSGTIVVTQAMTQ